MPAPPYDLVSLPALGERVPRKRNPLTQALSRAALTTAGWRFEGFLPNLPKFVVAVAPHTSNWDFVVGLLARRALGLDAHFLGKHTLFRPPFGWFMRWLGGTPVRRDMPGGVVQQVAETFRTHEAFVLGLAPEGTRKRVAAWRTGFYYIALEAGVPIVPVTFDYGRKRIAAAVPIIPTGDLDADLQPMRVFFAGATPLKPEGA